MRARPLPIACGLAMLIALAPARPLHADDSAAACADAAEEGQRLRLAGKLHAARARFEGCLRVVCPAFVQKDCAQFVLEVEATMPSIVVAAHDGAGGDLTAVRVTVDDAPFLERLDGKAVAIDPGVHTFRFEAADVPAVTKTIVVHEGEKSRVVAVTLAVEAPPPTKETLAPSTVQVRPIPIATWIAASVGTIALGVFAGFGLTARHDFDQLRASCGTSCAQADVDRVRRKAIVADVSLGVSVVSFGIATWTFLARPTETIEASAITVRATLGADAGSVFLAGSF